MEVRLQIGRYAGELRDVEPEAAREMIADGRATDPRFDDFPLGKVVVAGTTQVGERAHETLFPRAIANHLEAAVPERKPKRGRN